jgi:PAS domain S-box-containing protein
MRYSQDLLTPNGNPAAATDEWLFDLSIDPLCVLGRDGIIRRVNRAFTDTCGWTTADMESRSYLDFLHPEDHNRALAVAGHPTSDGPVLPGDYRWRCADGSYRWLAWRSSAADENGLLYAVARDVTQSKYSEAELRRQAIVFDHISDGIIVTDLQGYVTDWSDAAARMFGYSKAEMLGRRPDALHQLERTTTRVEDVLGAVATTGRWTGEMEYVTKDGREGVAEVDVAALRGPDGSLIGTVGVNRDITSRRAAEEELRAREARYRSLIETAYEGICTLDSVGTLTYVNSRFCDMLGLRVHDMVGQPFFNFMADEDAFRSRNVFARHQRGMAESYDLTLKRSDGSDVFAVISTSTLTDASGEFTGVLAMVTDITKRRQAERALRESEARYAHIALNVPGMVFQYTSEASGVRSFPFVSQGATDIFELTPEDIQAEPEYLFDTLHPADRERFNSSVSAAIRFDTPWRWTGRIIVNGTEKWIDGAARLQRTSDGAMVWDGILLDATQPRRAAERLEESEDRYRSLFENHPDAVFSLDFDGRFLRTNTACETVSGYSAEELLGRQFDSLVVPEQLEFAYAHLTHALGGTATSYDLAITHKSGRRVDVGITNVPVIVDGQIIGVFGIARDVTKQREMESHIRHAHKMEAIGQLAGGIAHDFNNILTVIQACSEFLEAALPESDVRREDVDMIHDAATRAATLTNQLLAFSRKQVLQPKLIDLNSCITDLQKMLGRLIGEDIILTTDLASGLGCVSADVGQLEQVLTNITVNARYAMPHGGELRVTTRSCTEREVRELQFPGMKPGPHVRLSISDTGCGMDEATVARIFEPFFTTRGPANGTGLGLATAYGIIEQSSGHILVSSKLGVGTTFEIILPMVPGAPEGVGPSKRRSINHGTETILLVEDDSNVRALASRILTHNGYSVIQASNGAEGLETVRASESQIDLVITDAIMPVMSGGELAMALATEYPKIKVLFMSGYTDDEIVKRGVVDSRAFIAKPFTTLDLTGKVREVLDSFNGNSRPHPVPVPSTETRRR